jgi:hypothetical protein
MHHRHWALAVSIVIGVTLDSTGLFRTAAEVLS